jgi:hypothetical protein
VSVAPARVSFVIGTVTLAMTPFVRSGTTYVSTYTAKVFPYFMFDERGRIVITASEDEVNRLEHGDAIFVVGRAVNEDGDHRRIECRATPSDKRSGLIKVRVVITQGIALTFNTSYALLGK